MPRRCSLWLMGALMLLLAGCASQPVATSTYTVRRGDTLYSIASQHRVSVDDLARINGIGRDYLVYPGQVLRFSKTTANAKARVTPQSLPPIDSKIVAINWQQPTYGTEFEKTARPNGGLGLVMRGQLGQDINAAAAGRVVYTGNGLLGYGQLIIIKHDEVYLSAYGHVQTVQIREGDQVVAGQRIATMGNGAAGTPMLYFEIRANGQPIDPLPLLQLNK